MRRFLIAMGAFALAGSTVCPAAAQDAAKLYEDNCASCHTIGQGVIGGPDLKNVTVRRDRDWLVRFVLNPEAFASEPVVAQMIKDADGLAMPATDGLTRELAEAILTWIDGQSGAGSARVGPFAPFTADESARGRLLFTGGARLDGGGPACVVCHAGGDVPRPATGRFGPDLSTVSERLGGGRGVTAWLKATPTAMMHGLYNDARIGDAEARALTAFLQTPAGPAPPLTNRPHIAGGLGMAVLALGFAGAVGRRRFGAVRRPLVEEARRHHGPRYADPRGRHTLGGSR